MEESNKRETSLGVQSLWLVVLMLVLVLFLLVLALFELLVKLLFALGRHAPPYVRLAHDVALVLEDYPLTHAILFGGNAHTPTAAANNDIARAVLRVGLHSPNGRDVDLCIQRDIAHFTTGQRPADRLP